MCAESKQTNKTNGDMEANDVPTNIIAKGFVSAYRAMPTIYFPFTQLNISFTLLIAAILYTIRLIFEKYLVTVLEWPVGTEGTILATGSFVAILHSIHLVPGLAVALLTQPYRPSAHISTAPQWWQDLVNALLQMCTGYMIYDSFASFLLPKGLDLSIEDLLFLGHHAATSIYMTQVRVLQAGQTSAMICMILGYVNISL